MESLPLPAVYPHTHLIRLRKEQPSLPAHICTQLVPSPVESLPLPAVYHPAPAANWITRGTAFITGCVLTCAHSLFHNQGHRFHCRLNTDLGTQLIQVTKLTHVLLSTWSRQGWRQNHSVLSPAVHRPVHAATSIETLTVLFPSALQHRSFILLGASSAWSNQRQKHNCSILWRF